VTSPAGTATHAAAPGSTRRACAGHRETAAIARARARVGGATAPWLEPPPPRSLPSRPARRWCLRPCRCSDLAGVKRGVDAGAPFTRVLGRGGGAASNRLASDRTTTRAKVGLSCSPATLYTLAFERWPGSRTTTLFIRWPVAGASRVARRSQEVIKTSNFIEMNGTESPHQAATRRRDPRREMPFGKS